MATAPSSPVPRWAATAACFLTSGGLWLAAAAPAWAHNTLVESTPEDGSTLDEAPSQVELVFDDTIMEGGNGIVVTGPDGSSTYESGEVAIDGETATIGLDPLEEAGDYSIDYRIISADGHPLEDSLSFTLSGDTLADQEDAAEQDADTDETPPAEIEDEPAAADEDQGGLGIPVWVGVVLAVGLIGMIVAILVRLARRNN